MAKRFWRARNVGRGTSKDFQTQAEAQAFADRTIEMEMVDPVTGDVTLVMVREKHVVEPTGKEAQFEEIAARPGVTTPFDRITVQRWTPDTCGCVIEQWVDDADKHMVSYASILTVGPEHAAAAGGEALWATVQNESDRKSAVLAIIEATTSLETKDDRTTWAFTSDRLPGTDERVLEVTIAGTTRRLRDSVQGAADVQFGSGAVVVL